MSITADFHMHSHFSGDSSAPPSSMIRSAIANGLTHICFTEHNDFDYPVSEELPAGAFILDVPAYYDSLAALREEYGSRIRLGFGIELGLMPSVAERNRALTASYPFDFVIGSSHLCAGRDPYYPSFYEGRSERAAYLEYFESISVNIQTFADFDVYGHLDYVVRYGPNKDTFYTYEAYKDIFEEILRSLIHAGKGIEINTAGAAKGLRELHPLTAVLKRYRQLGGEIITIGSDAHTPGAVAASFNRAEAILEECGFRYYTVFSRRTPSFLPL